MFINNSGVLRGTSNEPLPRLPTLVKGAQRLACLQDPKDTQEVGLIWERRNDRLCFSMPTLGLGTKHEERNTWVPRWTVPSPAHLCSWLSSRLFGVQEWPITLCYEDENPTEQKCPAVNLPGVCQDRHPLSEETLQPIFPLTLTHTFVY